MSAHEAPRAIIAGAGLMGRWHADASSRCGGRVVAVADPEIDAATAVARAVGARAYPDLARALHDVGASAPGTRVVHVCAPAGTHVQLAEAALEAGCHVLVEKPATPDGAAAERLVRAAEDRGLLLAPVHQFLFQPGFLRIVAEREAWGPLRHLGALACSAGAELPGASDPATVAYEIVPHFLSIVERLAPGSLDHVEWTVQHPLPGELHVAGADDGRVVSLTVSMSGRPTRNTLDVVGERGSAHADLFHGFATFEGPEVSRARKILRPFRHSSGSLFAVTANLARRTLRREPAYPGLRELVRLFYEAASRGGPAPIAPAETLAVARAHEAIGRRMRRGAPE